MIIRTVRLARTFIDRVQLAPFELTIALLLVLSGVRFLWRRDELEASQIGQTLPVPELWAAGYLGAGILIIAGVLVPAVRVEAAGLALMASVVSVNAIAFAYSYDVLEQWSFGVALIFYASLALAALARLRILFRGPTVVVRTTEAPKLDVGRRLEELDDGH